MSTTEMAFPQEAAGASLDTARKMVRAGPDAKAMYTLLVESADLKDTCDRNKGERGPGGAGDVRKLQMAG